MKTIEVDPRALEEAATTLRTAAEELRAASHRIGGALLLVGSAGGSASLSATSATAAQRWTQGLEAYADAGRALSAATEAAAELYGLVEWQARRTFTPVGHP